jgi:hypothetical protein
MGYPRLRRISRNVASYGSERRRVVESKAT